MSMIKHKGAREIFGAVDPHLTVISAKPRTPRKAGRIKRGITDPLARPHSTTLDDWERCGGEYCTVCGCETVRLIQGRCLKCCSPDM